MYIEENTQLKKMLLHLFQYPPFNKTDMYPFIDALAEEGYNELHNWLLQRPDMYRTFQCYRDFTIPYPDFEIVPATFGTRFVQDGVVYTCYDGKELCSSIINGYFSYLCPPAECITHDTCIYCGACQTCGPGRNGFDCFSCGGN